MKMFFILILLLPLTLIAQNYGHVTDVFNQTIDLDSIIIDYAGRFGIPPQLIKAQIHKESLFKPAMRYEPYLDIKYQSNPDWADSVRNNQYWVDSTTNGNPPSPSNHRFWYFNQWTTSYPMYVGSIYDIWSKHQNQYSKKIYPKMQDVYDSFVFHPLFEKAKKDHKDWTTDQQIEYADSIADTSWPLYLKEKYKGGMMNFPAQTRIMSSYGFLQMIYFIALTERGYSQNDSHSPEVLMETDTSLTYSTRHLIAMFRKDDIKEDYSSDHSWKLGFEQTWYRALGYYNGNYSKTTHKSVYADSVFIHMKDYLPQSR